MRFNNYWIDTEELLHFSHSHPPSCSWRSYQEFLMGTLDLRHSLKYLASDGGFSIRDSIGRGSLCYCHAKWIGLIFNLGSYEIQQLLDRYWRNATLQPESSSLLQLTKLSRISDGYSWPSTLFEVPCQWWILNKIVPFPTTVKICVPITLKCAAIIIWEKEMRLVFW